MQEQLKAVTSAVAQADLDWLPVTIRRAYEAGASVEQVRAAVAVGCYLGRVTPAVRAQALEVVNAWAWMARGQPDA